MSILADASGLEEAAVRAAAESRSGRALFEAFVPGPEVTVNGFTAEGHGFVAAVTDRIHFEGAPGVARRHVYPTERNPAAAAAAAARAVEALGIGAGPWYVQVILGPDGPRIVEVAARLGGGHDSELVKLTTGVDLAHAAVLAALGRPVSAADVTPAPDGAGVIEFLEAPLGTLRRAAGPAEASFYDAPGHVYGPIRIATDRAGYVLAGGATRDDALARAAAAAAAVRVVVT
jgi:biotin carboxylase